MFKAIKKKFKDYRIKNYSKDKFKSEIFNKIQFRVVENIEEVEYDNKEEIETIDFNPTFNYTNILLINNDIDLITGFSAKLTDISTGETDFINPKNTYGYDKIKLLNNPYFNDSAYILDLRFRKFSTSKILSINYRILLTLEYKSFKIDGEVDDNKWIIYKIRYLFRIFNKWVELKKPKVRRLRRSIEQKCPYCNSLLKRRNLRGDPILTRTYWCHRCIEYVEIKKDGN